MTAVVVVLTVVVAVLALLVVGLLRSHATILRALHDAGIDLDMDPHTAGARPPATGAPEIRTQRGVPGPAGASGQRGHDLAGTSPSGATRTVGVTGGGATLLAFLTSGCRTCAGFWEAFGRGLDLPDGVRLVVVTKGPELESPSAVAELAPPGVVTLQSTQAWDDYRIPVAPYFVLVDGDRGVVVGEGAAATWDRVADLLARSLADDETSPASPASPSRRALLRGRGGRAREARVDGALRDAGIEPGDPRLHHDTAPAGFDRAGFDRGAPES